MVSMDAKIYSHCRLTTLAQLDWTSEGGLGKVNKNFSLEKNDYFLTELKILQECRLGNLECHFLLNNFVRNSNLQGKISFKSCHQSRKR